MIAKQFTIYVCSQWFFETVESLLTVPLKVKNTKSLSVIIYQSGIHLEDLLSQPENMQLEMPWDSPAFTSLPVTLRYTETDQTWFGAFKLAFKANASVILPRMTSTTVCLKQLHYKKTARGEPRKVMDPARQLQDLPTELSCLLWARCLMELVYTFISKKKEFPGTIPQFRFVEAGLAFTTPDIDQVFLVEEWIEPSKEHFFKYINNSSATPLFEYLPEKYHNNARFLAFAQHVQFVKTGRLAYLSDLQGDCFLRCCLNTLTGLFSLGTMYTLTDPQIITSMYVHLFQSIHTTSTCLRLNSPGKFARGNLNHELFVEQHPCNEFCRWFGLARLQELDEFVPTKDLGQDGDTWDNHTGGHIDNIIDKDLGQDEAGDKGGHIDDDIINHDDNGSNVDNHEDINHDENADANQSALRDNHHNGNDDDNRDIDCPTAADVSLIRLRRKIQRAFQRKFNIPEGNDDDGSGNKGGGNKKDGGIDEDSDSVIEVTTPAVRSKNHRASTKDTDGPAAVKTALKKSENHRWSTKNAATTDNSNKPAKHKRGQAAQRIVTEGSATLAEKNRAAKVSSRKLRSAGQLGLTSMDIPGFSARN